MKAITIDPSQKGVFNLHAIHPLQAYEWGEFREKTGVKVIRRGIETNGKITDGFQITIHPIPHTPFTIGYFPKSTLPTKDILAEVQNVGKENNCIFIQFEPAVEETDEAKKTMQKLGLIPSAHPLFTKYNFVFDLTKTEEELLKHMHPKTRYNIRIAQKHNVKIEHDSSDERFEQYWKLMQETTNRQGFYAHTKKYHALMWRTLGTKDQKPDTNTLNAHLLLAKYKPENEAEVVLTAWILFSFHDTLYYPYGSSSSEYRKVMASNLMMWEAIRFGKQLGLQKFDMWGALGPNPDTNDPWYGFHRFKEGYGPRHVTYVGSYDFVLNPGLYQLYKVADKVRWPLMRLKKKFLK